MLNIAFPLMLIFSLPSTDKTPVEASTSTFSVNFKQTKLNALSIFRLAMLGMLTQLCVDKFIGAARMELDSSEQANKIAKSASEISFT